MTSIEPTTGPLAELRHEHEVILRAMDLAERAAAGVEAGRPGSRQTLASLVDFFQTFADRCHHGKEEQHLFPALARRGVPIDGGPIGVMLAEHDEGRRLLGTMARGTDAEAVAAVRDYSALLRAHIDKENEVLFPMAASVLTEREQRDLAASFEAVEQTVIGPGIHERLLAELARVEAVLSGVETTV